MSNQIRNPQDHPESLPAKPRIMADSTWIRDRLRRTAEFQAELRQWSKEAEDRGRGTAAHIYHTLAMHLQHVESQLLDEQMAIEKVEGHNA